MYLVTALAFSQEGSLLASASPDGTIRIWDLAKEKTVRVFKSLPTEYGITSLSFSQDNERLAAGNYLGARLWNFGQEACRVLKGHESYVYRVTFHPDGSLLASSAWDDTVRLWDPFTGEPLATLPAGQSRWKLSFSPDGTRLIGGKIWDPATGDRLLAPRNESDPALLEGIAGQMRVRQRYNSLIRIFAGGAKLAAGSGERVALSWDRSLLADGLESGGICIDDRATGRTVKQIGQHDSPVISTTFSPDKTKVVSGHEDGVIKVWDLESGTELAFLKGHTRTVYTVNYNPDGSRIASGSDDNNIILWDAEIYEQVAVLRGHTSYVHSVCFSPDGTMLASASGDGTVRVWDTVPPAERWAQVQQEKALQRETAPLVDRLLAELGDPLDVADRLRADESLSDDFRRAALRVLLERSVAGREKKVRESK
ncbi:MAG: WD40 repeat domain-containing protein [Planctomycetota bacterium]|jgi:hypothetical protein